MAAQAIFDPFAPLEEQLADSVSKGFLTPDGAEALLASDAFAAEHEDTLRAEFPGQAISIVPDATLERGFATYAGESSYESENKARQFSPGIPYFTLEPVDALGAPFLFADPVFPDLADWLEGAGATLRKLGDELPKLAQEQGKDGDKDELEKLWKKVIEELEKARADKKMSDAELLKAFPPSFEGHSITVGGLISDSDGHENIKIWMIDTGATFSTISKENFERLQKKGAKPKQDGEVEVETANGKAKLPKYSGIPMQFGRKDKDNKPELAKCDVPVIVATLDLLGLDQLKKTGTKLILDPAGNSVELVAR
jgi:hypothetical protein